MENTSPARNGGEPPRHEQPHGLMPPNDTSHRDASSNQEHQRHERIYWIVTGAASVAATAAAVVAATYAISAYKAAREQVAIAQAALVSSERPWLSIEGRAIQF